MRLAEIRQQKGYSIYRVGKLSGISQPQIRAIENEVNSPTIKTLGKLATALGVSLFELIGEETKNNDFNGNQPLENTTERGGKSA